MQNSEVKGNILVVDDTLDNINLLATMLTEIGYKVRKALSGQMALMGVQAAPPDLILLDISMPEMNGYEVCEKLKASEQTRDIPVIFLSALDNVLDKVKAFSIGGVDYITKPFQLEEVVVRVENHLTIRRLQKQLSEQNSLLKKSEALEREKSQQLEITLRKLQQTQAQLIQSEKMSSLGQLVAGIAHEINNPINFIYGNLSPIEQYSISLLLLIEQYQQELPTPSAAIQELEESHELEFLKEDLPALLLSVKSGVQRIRDLVLSLRSFSRLGEAEVKKVNIHDGLDSTLVILQHRLNAQSNRPAIMLEKEYSKLPEVECYAGQINQVFLHILNNAIDALEKVNWETSQSSPKIRICTQLIDSSHIAIAISDNGIGINESLQKKIFDPFFTTKKIGSGIGMGLSISYQIVVESHGGELFCESMSEQGTTFNIILPLQCAKVI